MLSNNVNQTDKNSMLDTNTYCVTQKRINKNNIHYRPRLTLFDLNVTSIFNECMMTFGHWRNCEKQELVPTIGNYKCSTTQIYDIPK